MSDQEKNYTVTITDKELVNRLKSFSDSTGHSLNEITEQALKNYFSNMDDATDEGEDEVFNPDPGA